VPIPPPTQSTFTADSLKFLRALKRNNRREWFQPRKDEFERLVRAPMVALVERLAVDFEAFAPDLVASPKTSIYRIYRDTRFSENKTPYKTHIAAHFPRRDMPKGSSAGLYLHVGADEVWLGGGLYMPTTSQLVAIREQIANHLRQFRAIVESPAFRKQVGRLEGDKLQRVPRGYPKDHEAAEYLRFRQFLAGCEFEPGHATSQRFYRDVVSVFKQVAPLVRFLNDAIAGAAA
jgi:uncharacterized protein (TIGR02453 family)